MFPLATAAREGLRENGAKFQVGEQSRGFTCAQVVSPSAAFRVAPGGEELQQGATSSASMND